MLRKGRLTLNVYYNPREVGRRIRQVRRVAKITQENLSEEMCISREMLSRIENGKNACSPDHLTFLCQRFDKRADYFYFGEEYENNSKTRLEMINEIKVMLQSAERERVWEIYKIMKILINI